MNLTKSAHILLGSNIDPVNNVRRAIDYLNKYFEVSGISKIYQTEPVKKKNVEKYLNAVVEIQTDLPPASIKYDYLRKIEDDMGRIRTKDKFKPRVIDLDLILYEDLIYDDGDIILPDPEILTYGHVAIPLADIVPEKEHPIVNRTFMDIAKELEQDSKLNEVVF